MTTHCGYRSPCVSGNKPFGSPPDYYICACPAGEAALGYNCLDDAAKCKTALHYEATGLPSYRYKRSAAKTPKAQRRKITSIEEVINQD